MQIPWRVCVPEFIEQLREPLNVSWAPFPVPCTNHHHAIPLLVLSRQSGNGRIGWYLSYLSLYWHKQFKGQEIYFDSWLEVFPTCNSWATCPQVWVRIAVNAAQHELMILVFESWMRASGGTQWIKALATKLEDLIWDPRTYLIEKENQLLHAVFWLPYMCIVSVHTKT